MTKVHTENEVPGAPKITVFESALLKCSSPSCHDFHDNESGAGGLETGKALTSNAKLGYKRESHSAHTRGNLVHSEQQRLALQLRQELSQSNTK